MNHTDEQQRMAEEYYEKLGAVLHVLDTFNIEPNDRAALLWIARDYHDLLGEVIEISVTK